MLRHPEYTADVYMKWEEALQDAALNFNEKSTYIKTQLYTEYGVEEAYVSDLERDLSLIPAAITVVGLYIIFILGSWSPIHCRLLVGIFGVVCICLSFAAGCALMIIMGYQFSTIH